MFRAPALRAAPRPRFASTAVPLAGASPGGQKSPSNTWAADQTMR